ncbi:hypothetical protein [Romboutsia lituseburensis]|uniref:hypothetical protein n=1 Tax=Romboutsia lituseburensis TaxID=1537 RepID=UPI00215B41A6|nr:hypothetical protein [Romboutsia lituseburensis]MCR8746143.1 hypothetical protein [Romboutsia lituseburensis]
MSLSLGNAIAVSTNIIKSNPAVPVYKGEENSNNLYAVIYHIEIGYNEGQTQKTKQYIIIDYKEFDLSIDAKNELIKVAKQYCKSKGINDDEQLEIALLDNEEAENFLEKVFNNMKVIRGLITKKD